MSLEYGRPEPTDIKILKKRRYVLLWERLLTFFWFVIPSARADRKAAILCESKFKDEAEAYREKQRLKNALKSSVTIQFKDKV